MFLPPNFWNNIPGWLVWVFLGLMLLGFVGSRMSEAYPLIAKLIPFFGNYWRSRALREDEEREERAKELASELVEHMKPPDYDREMAAMNHRLKLVEDREEVNQAYLVYDAAWHWSADIAIAETGLAIKFPPRISYSEFSRKYLDGWRPEGLGTL